MPKFIYIYKYNIAFIFQKNFSEASFDTYEPYFMEVVGGLIRFLNIFL
jgi:hypothetical protein